MRAPAMEPFESKLVTLRKNSTLTEVKIKVCCFFFYKGFVMISRGDLVWGKLKSFPWWPAIIIHPEDCGRDRKSKEDLWIFWFGDHKVSELKNIPTVKFKEHFAENYKNSKNPAKIAIQEILSVYAEQRQVNITDFDSLLKWANSGFEPSSGLSGSRRRKDDDLPAIVFEALQEKQFKRKIEINEDTEDEIDEVLNNVRKGSETLEDICVVCCQREVTPVMKHPLFIGGVCKTCKKDIVKISNMPAGKAYDACIICGQGGKLVYCSSDLCKRAYCELCIEYLDSEDTFAKTLQNNNWRCYLCSNVCDVECLIKKREFHIVKPISLPSLPSLPCQKLPMRVIAENNVGLSVLTENNIVPEVYCSEPIVPTQHIEDLIVYKDFTAKEFSDIRANLIYGSFFPSNNSHDQITWLKYFSASFYRFLFRLDNAKLYRTEIIFIFVSDSSMLEDEVLARVLRFLRVNPVSVKLYTKKYLIWCNVPGFR
ncbi:hypothetical protein JTE90_016853 [Oedothorax gibbosus]|uniref:DNA (cytosine-5-)-methyltransferase n=1 Tax=Oedothorax gibbosus TaxID=931172 RepID=A0AAV6W0N9_9ARAC|nr:hypothetical protein JTE90_016853 [Oedothorax gibbosus]